MKGKQVTYKQMHDFTGGSKFMSVLGIIFLVIGILIFIDNMSTIVGWRLSAKNYTKEYVCSEYGALYYELNGEQISIQNIYNSNAEKIEMDVPDGEMIELYVSKENINNALYLDPNDRIDDTKIHPLSSMFVVLFCTCIGLFLFLSGREYEKGKTTLNSILPVFVIMCITGVGIGIYQAKIGVSNLMYKLNGSTTTATICSQIYDSANAEETIYKPVAYYYVNGEKYYYVWSFYTYGSLNEDFGKTFELYYNEADPSKSSALEDEVDPLLSIFGLGFILWSVPFVFSKKEIWKKVQWSDAQAEAVDAGRSK